jgi:WhiB family transcriptional regulator, redox-sensing transcriptional regulator
VHTAQAKSGTAREAVPIEGFSIMRVEEAQPNMYEPGGTKGGALSWQERALCAQTDPEAFFPEKGGSTREAKKVCLSCEVRGECLEYALANDERFGIWGGLSERERRKLKKRAV